MLQCHPRVIPWAAGGAGLVLAAAAGAQPYSVVSPTHESGGRFGTSVAGVPDVNNDGRGDFVAGAPNETVVGIPAAGRIFLFDNKPDGKARFGRSSPNREPNGNFGFSVGGVPDVNGDGHGDIVVGAPNENPGGSPVNAGRVYVYSGNTGVLRLTIKSPNEEANGRFGWAVAGIGDVTGDGRGDLIIGAIGEDPFAAPDDAGRVYVFNGFNGKLWKTLVSPWQEVNGGFGAAIAAVPDVNGDGIPDVVVGALFENPGNRPTDAGRAYVFSGATGAHLRGFDSPNAEEDGFFGNSVAGVPDVNGDGRGDILVGAPYETVNGVVAAGRAYLFSGATGALLRQWSAGQPFASDIFGFTVAGIGDINGDGRGDVIIGSKSKTIGGQTDIGRVYLYSGATGAFLNALAATKAEIGSEFGAAISAVPDTNKDGRPDIVVGAPKEDVGQKVDAGRVYLYR